MGRVETVLEFGECLHKLSHIFSRSGIYLVFGTQIPNETREKTFGGTHRLE